MKSEDTFAPVVPLASPKATTSSRSLALMGKKSIVSPTSDALAAVPRLLLGAKLPSFHASQVEANIPRLDFSFKAFSRELTHVETSESNLVESIRQTRTLDKYMDVCSEILSDFLYVSNLRVAHEAAHLATKGITHLINCCEHKTSSTSHDAKFEVLNLFLQDTTLEDLTPFFPQVIEYITQCRTQRTNKVLIYCQQGISRSCALAIAYVMFEKRVTCKEAIEYVRQERGISNPNTAFLCQLFKWEDELRRKETSLLGLYRLAPHSNYDPETFVLKPCYKESAQIAHQRQEMAAVRSLEDVHHLLWTRGTFVFQSPIQDTDVIVWKGEACEIPNAVSMATRLVRQLLQVHALGQSPVCLMNIVEIYESLEYTGTDHDLFSYATELEWSQKVVIKAPSLLLLPVNEDATDTTTSNGLNDEILSGYLIPPQIFKLEAFEDQNREDLWNELTNYDVDDLTADSAFLLYSVKTLGIVESYVWLGANCNMTVDLVSTAAQKLVQRLSDGSFTAPVPLERQDQESDAFWQLFEAGY